jgi:hypothetical protein
MRGKVLSHARRQHEGWSRIWPNVLQRNWSCVVSKPVPEISFCRRKQENLTPGQLAANNYSIVRIDLNGWL